MKIFLPLLIFILCLPGWLSAQQGDISLQGRVISASDSLPLPGASITIKGSVTGTTTDAEGNFQLTVPEGEIVVFSYIGFSSREIPVTAGSPTSLTVILTDDYLTLSEVEIYSTGYQDVPAERATGSFEHIDNKLFNRSVSTDVISRLEGVTSGLLLDYGRNSDMPPGESSPTIRIRGMSTMYGSSFSGKVSDKDEPLIIVDNFPFEGDLNNINPNDVQNVTVLKDAAAASIWGARAGNGVIVITTKRGGYRKPLSISLNSNITIKEKPDIYYSPSFLSSDKFIQAEREFFDNGLYTGDETDGAYPMISPAVEVFIKERDEEISSEEANSALAKLGAIDVRNEISRYFYRPAFKQQYALNLNGGTDKLKYYFSGGMDRNLAAVKGDEYNRLTFNTTNTIRPVKNLEISFGVYFSQQKDQNNGLGFNEIKHYTKHILPYASLADAAGNALPIIYQYRTSYVEDAAAQGLLDWKYRPLDELNYRQDNTINKENRFSLGLKYQILKGLDLELKYQEQDLHGERNLIRNKESYQVRDLVNRFTQDDGEMVFPYNDIWRIDERNTKAQNGRVQLNFSRDFSNKHLVTALAGMEVREINSDYHASEIYGYDPDVLTYPQLLDYVTYFPTRPQYSGRIPTPYSNVDVFKDRYVSYYTNASYLYAQRYIVSGSARQDASNIFGVATNQKKVPLWSAGIGWIASNENFYHASWLPLLKLRITYGSSGNVDKSATAFTTAHYGTDTRTDLPEARIEAPGNPDLRWEKVKTTNIGLDFSLVNDRLSGSLEYFRKESVDLLAPLPLDPTTGFLGTYTVNYASLLTKGMDISLTNSTRIGSIHWKSTMLFSYARDKVTDFDWDGEGSWGRYFADTSLPKKGESLYLLYSFPWIGLDPDSGDPLVISEGQKGTDYSQYLNTFDPSEELIANGPKIPPFYGSFITSLTWKNLSLSFNISWKAGYYFRRSAINYYDLFNSWQGNKEFSSRWQKPGDEKLTNVPSIPDRSLNSYRDLIYQDSELTVEKGDHIRLRDINLSYEIIRGDKQHFPVERMRLYFYASNLGIIWKANHKGLDPDYATALYTPERSYALGIQLDF